MAAIKGKTDALFPIDIKIVFNLKDINFISSSFIRICMGTAKQVPPGNFCITNCDPFIKKTFKIAGLDGLLNVS
jgi:anti-anti-sigma factor